MVVVWGRGLSRVVCLVVAIVVVASVGVAAVVVVEVLVPVLVLVAVVVAVIDVPPPRLVRVADDHVEAAQHLLDCCGVLVVLVHLPSWSCHCRVCWRCVGRRPVRVAVSCCRCPCRRRAGRLRSHRPSKCRSDCRCRVVASASGVAEHMVEVAKNAPQKTSSVVVCLDPPADVVVFVGCVSDCARQVQVDNLYG